MKIKILKENLLQGIQTTQNVVSPKSSLPILSNILIETIDKKLKLIATDLDIGIVSFVESDNIEQGSITLPAKRFSDIIKELPHDNHIQITVKKNNIAVIETKNCQFKIPGLPKEEFPSLPEFKDKEAIVIDQELLKEMIMLTSFSVSHDETRYILNGILIEINNNYISMVATDGRRLAVIKRKLDKTITKSMKVIIPIKAILELSRNLKEEGQVSLVASNNQVLFDLGDTLLITRLIEGEFPDYQQIIPPETTQKIKFNREELLLAAKRAALLSTPDYQAVKLEIFKNKLVVSKATPDVGESREEVSVEYAGKELVIGFNPAYLIDALKNLFNETLDLEVSEADKPGIIRTDGYIYIVLPMRLG